MSNNVRISAKYRQEPDYGKLARALLLFLEQEAEKEAAAANAQGASDNMPDSPVGATSHVEPDSEVPA